MRKHTPDISLTAVRALQGSATDIDVDSFPAYGAPLHLVIAEQAPWRSWLEAAVLAGYVPHMEGIELALRAAHLLHHEQVDESLAAGAEGDALNWMEVAQQYRQIAARLDSWADEMDHRRAQIESIIRLDD